MTASDFVSALSYIFVAIFLIGGALVLYMKNKLYEKRIIEYLSDESDYPDYPNTTPDFYLARNDIRQTTPSPPPEPRVVVNPPPFKNVNNRNQMFSMIDEEDDDNTDLVMDWMKRVQEGNSKRRKNNRSN